MNCTQLAPPVLALSIALLASCNPKSGKPNAHNTPAPTDTVLWERNKEAREDSAKMAEALMLQSQIANAVQADAETPPVGSEPGADAADDPAIWINPNDPEKSLVIGTNKKAGLHLYNLKGEELQFIAVGNVNNVDVCYRFSLNGRQMDLVGASNRTHNSIDIFQIDAMGLKITEKPLLSIPSTVDDVYGFCFFHNTKNNTHYAFVNGKNGKIEQWLLHNHSAEMKAELVRSFWMKSQPEGMVVDPVTHTLFVGVEEEGIYKIDAEATADTTAIKIASSDSTNPAISYDIEGLTVYRISPSKGYLVVSVQGNFSYALFDLNAPNPYLTNFKITDGLFDGAEETDGLDATALPLGIAYPNGILVVQDGFNKDGETDLNQNFKIVSFKKILRFMP